MRGRDRGDAGAYLVLYALLGTALFTMAAIVLDIAGLRHARRTDRMTADLAASAGAADLSETTGLTACLTALGYAMTNLTEAAGTLTPADPCTAVFVAPCTAATARRSATATIGQVTIEISNPVPNADALMMAEAQRGDIAQTPVDSVDGTDATRCERLAVRILRSRTFLFGPVAGVGGASTDVHSVARLIGTGGSEITPLVALDTAGCPGVSGAGGTLRAIAPGGTNDEAIAVDTNSCAAGTAVFGTVRAELPGGLAGFARVTSATNTGALAFGSIRAPTASTGTLPVENRYNTLPPAGCGANPCTATTIAAALGGPVGVPAGYIDVTPFFPNCRSSDFGVPVAGRFYINCPGPGGFTVDSIWSLTSDTSLVLQGPVSVSNNNCMSIAAVGCVVPGAASVFPSLVFIRNGDLSIANNSGLVLNNTTVYLANGRIDLNGNPNTRTWWRAPAVDTTTCPVADPTPSPACEFDDLLLWSKASTTAHEFRSGGLLNLEGTLYVPNATVLFESSATGTATAGFQVFANRVASTSGTAIIQPSAARAVPDIRPTTRLLR